MSKAQETWEKMQEEAARTGSEKSQPKVRPAEEKKPAPRQEPMPDIGDIEIDYVELEDY